MDLTCLKDVIASISDCRQMQEKSRYLLHDFSESHCFVYARNGEGKILQHTAHLTTFRCIRNHNDQQGRMFRQPCFIGNVFMRTCIQLSIISCMDPEGSISIA